MTRQDELDFDGIPEEMKRKEEMRLQCEAFHKAHPEVWNWFVHVTKARIAEGFKHFGAKAIMEDVRWLTRAGGDGKETIKIGNNHTSFYSRRFADNNPQHAGFFRFRRQTSADHPATGQPAFKPSDARHETHEGDPIE